MEFSVSSLWCWAHKSHRLYTDTQRGAHTPVCTQRQTYSMTDIPHTHRYTVTHTAFADTHIYTQLHTPYHPHIHTYIYTTYTQTHTIPHPHTLTHTQIHTHTDIHTQSSSETDQVWIRPMDRTAVHTQLVLLDCVLRAVLIREHGQVPGDPSLHCSPDRM